ncbi:HNH/ENDO VII family nuclease [Idiomarina abyssalis]|uniref:HNH/ENDO VII family nuclease n=1 Tax=Idiomarina abyssalis TaxID=86102 RepID=UPI003A90308E
MNAIPAGASDILVDENDHVIAYTDEQEGTVICVPNCGSIKPNNQAAPGPIGNTQGIIVPQTAPEASGAANSAPTPEVEQEGLSIREQNRDLWKSLSDNSDSAAGKALSDLMGYVTDSAIASASDERWSEVISDETRANAQQYWQNQKDNADSFGAYYLAHLAGLAAEVGHDFIEGGAALSELALSDSLKQQVAMETVQGAIEAASNPMAVLEGAKASMQAFMDLPGAEQADEAFKAVLTTLLPAGRLKKLIEPKVPRPDVDANVPESPRTTQGADSKTSTETEHGPEEAESKPDSDSDQEVPEGKDGGYVDGSKKSGENEYVEGEVPDSLDNLAQQGSISVEPLNPSTRFYVSPEGEVLDTKTYARNSGFRKGVRDEVWNDAVNPETGLVNDPLTDIVMKKDEPWDMGHRPGMEFRKERDNAINKWLDNRDYTTRKEFLDKLNDPKRYRPELPSSNRSHRDEDATNDFWE